MKNDIRLMLDSEMNKAAITLAIQALQKPYFTEDLVFNPIKDLPEIFKSAKKVVEVNGRHYLEEVSDLTKKYIKTEITKISNEVIAGIFIEITKVMGTEAFQMHWTEYMEDFILRGTAGDPFIVAHLISSASVAFEFDHLPDGPRVTAMKVIARWTDDLKNNDSTWCKAPAHYKVHRNLPVYAQLKQAAKRGSLPMNKLLNLKGVKRWLPQDANTIFLWCIASGVHPIRLLNFIGHWLTHRDRQPEGFGTENPVTQPHEVERRKKGKLVDYVIAPAQFSAGFILRFANLIREVSWFDSKGVFIEPIGETFIRYAECFVLEDFSMMGGIEWQELPLTAVGEKYYRQSGITNINQNTVKELSDNQAERLLKKQAIRRNKISASTGNPLFDVELLKDSDD